MAGQQQVTVIQSNGAVIQGATLVSQDASAVQVKVGGSALSLRARDVTLVSSVEWQRSLRVRLASLQRLRDRARWKPLLDAALVEFKRRMQGGGAVGGGRPRSPASAMDDLGRRLAETMAKVAGGRLPPSALEQLLRDLSRSGSVIAAYLHMKSASDEAALIMAKLEALQANADRALVASLQANPQL